MYGGLTRNLFLGQVTLDSRNIIQQVLSIRQTANGQVLSVLEKQDHQEQFDCILLHKQTPLLDCKTFLLLSSIRRLMLWHFVMRELQ